MFNSLSRRVIIALALLTLSVSATPKVTEINIDIVSLDYDINMLDVRVKFDTTVMDEFDTQIYCFATEMEDLPDESTVGFKITGVSTNSSGIWTGHSLTMFNLDTPGSSFSNFFDPTDREYPGHLTAYS